MSDLKRRARICSVPYFRKRKLYDQMSFFRSIDRSGVTLIHLLSNLISRKPDISIGFCTHTLSGVRVTRLQCAKNGHGLELGVPPA